MEVENNGVYLGSGESSSLVQKFSNNGPKRTEMVLLANDITYFQVGKMGALPSLFIMQLGETSDTSQCTKLHVFMCSLTSSKKNSILGHFLEIGRTQHLWNNSFTNKYSNGRKKWYYSESRCAPVMSGAHRVWLSCFDEERIATLPYVSLLSISAAVITFPRGIAKKCSRISLFCTLLYCVLQVLHFFYELKVYGNPAHRLSLFQQHLLTLCLCVMFW